MLRTGSNKAYLGMGSGPARMITDKDHPLVYEEVGDALIPPFADLDEKYAAVNHQHDVNQISNFPTTMTPTSHSHAAGDVTSGTFAAARIPNLNASKITAGTLPVARGGTGQTSIDGLKSALGIGAGFRCELIGTASNMIFGSNIKIASNVRIPDRNDKSIIGLIFELDVTVDSLNAATGTNICG